MTFISSTDSGGLDFAGISRIICHLSFPLSSAGSLNSVSSSSPPAFLSEWFLKISMSSFPASKNYYYFCVSMHYNMTLYNCHIERCMSLRCLQVITCVTVMIVVM